MRSRTSLPVAIAVLFMGAASLYAALSVTAQDSSTPTSTESSGASASTSFTESSAPTKVAPQESTASSAPAAPVETIPHESFSSSPPSFDHTGTPPTPPESFVPTADDIRAAIQANSNHPICFIGTGWRGKMEECAGKTIYYPQDVGLPSGMRQWPGVLPHPGPHPSAPTTPGTMHPVPPGGDGSPWGSQPPSLSPIFSNVDELIAKLQKQIERREGKIVRIGQRIAKLEHRIAKHEQLLATAEDSWKRAAIEQKIEHLEEKWDFLEERQLYLQDEIDSFQDKISQLREYRASS